MHQFLVPAVRRPKPVGLTRGESRPLPMDLKALTHPTRWLLLWILERHEHHLCVQELAAQVEGPTLPTISYHLRSLRKAGFIEGQKQGTHVYYFLRRDRLREVGLLLVQLGHEDV